jgi:hypothetical protein
LGVPNFLIVDEAEIGEITKTGHYIGTRWDFKNAFLPTVVARGNKSEDRNGAEAQSTPSRDSRKNYE